MLETLLQSNAFGIALLRRAKKDLSAHKYDRAESCCTSCIRVYEHRMRMKDGLDHIDDVRKFGRAYRLLAEAIDLSVRLQEAIECCEEGMRKLENAIETVDGCDIAAYDAIGALATKRAYVFYRRGGKQDKVESGFWDAYRWYLRSGNQSGVAEALIRLGISHRLNGSYAKALECVEMVEDSIDVNALEKSYPSFYIYVRMYEGDFNIAAGRFSDAEKYLKDAERAAAQPWVDISVARRAQLNLEFSYLYYNTGRYEPGEKYGREALMLEIEAYGDKSVESCNGLNQIGWCLLRQGKLTDAYGCFRESYDIRLRLYTDMNPFTLVSLRNCAIAHKEMGGEWLSVAKNEFEHVLTLRQELSRQDAQASVAGAHLDLCSVLLAMGQPADALKHAKLAEEIFRVEVGDKTNNQRGYALCCISIGESFLAMKAPSDALPWLQKAVVLYEKAYGADSDHHNLLHARQLLSEAAG